MKYTDNYLLRLIVELLVDIKVKLVKQNIKLRNIIMSQAEFDAQLLAINEAIDGVNFKLTQISDAIAAEAAQIAAFIESHPEVDTSALDGVENRLVDVINSLDNTRTAVGGIFEPAPAVAEEG